MPESYLPTIFITLTRNWISHTLFVDSLHQSTPWPTDFEKEEDSSEEWRFIAEDEGKCRLRICVLSGLWKCYNAVSQWTRNSLKALELTVWFLVLFYEWYPCSQNSRYKVSLPAVNKKSYLQLEVNAHTLHFKVQPWDWMRNDRMHSE